MKLVSIHSFYLLWNTHPIALPESRGFRSAYDFLLKKKKSFLHNSESKQHDSPPHPGKFRDTQCIK